MYYLFLCIICIVYVKAHIKVDPRIVGGKACNVGGYPYVVSIHLRDPVGSSYGHYCAGTLLNPTWVLSAAHCYAQDKTVEEYLVVAGIANLSQFNNHETQKSKVEKIVFNHYVAEEHRNDISLIKLKTQLRKTNTVKFVTLPSNRLEPNELSEIFKKCTTMGWGVLVPVDVMGSNKPLTKESYPDQLMCVNLPLITFKQCKDLFHKKAPDVILSNTQMCTLTKLGRKDACIGDSGGPLICGKLQQGLTSWGLGCAQTGYPGVFTKVDNYINWIRSVVGKVQMRRQFQRIEKTKSGSDKKLPTVLLVLLAVVGYVHCDFNN